MLAPIIILSFNRPRLLRSVLESLKNQSAALLRGREIHLFQDGAINRYSRIRYADEAVIEASIAVFREYFPLGSVHRSADNIGICESYLSAERYAFEERHLDVAYFLEDDLVLSPVYLEVMEHLGNWAQALPNVGYFAAYGDSHSPREDIVRRRRELRTLDHHWAFGLFRRHWQAMQPLLEPFYSIVCGNDYHRRDHAKIFALYDRLDVAPPASSQHAAKAIACDRLGLWRANTVVPFAQYIGNIGQQTTPPTLADIVLDPSMMTDSIGHDFKFPDANSVNRLLSPQHALFHTIRQAEFANLTANLPPHQYNPMRLCEAIDVEFGCRLFLNRLAESDQLAASVGTRSVFEFMSELTESEEFQRIPQSPASGYRPCTRDDVKFAYRLSLHRDPENEAPFSEHVGKTDAGVFARSTWRAAEGQSLRQRVIPAGSTPTSPRLAAIKSWPQAIQAGTALVQQVKALDQTKHGVDKMMVATELEKLFATLCNSWGSDLKVFIEFCDVNVLMHRVWHNQLACVNLKGRECRLAFHDSLLLTSDPDAGLIFAGYCWVLLLVIEQAAALGIPLHGRFVFEDGDNGGLDAVSFCSRGANPCLILDHEFASSEGYAPLRHAYDLASPPWEERRNQVFWRGATTGRRLKTPPGLGMPDDFSWLQRLRLCVAAQAASIAGYCDIGIAKVVQIPEPHLIDRIMAADLVRSQVERTVFAQYKINVDIDGNSNSWAGLFSSLLGGSCVLKVASPGGYRQWYYEELKPGENYIPMKANLSDFEASVRWAVEHEATCGNIAARGHELATRITFEQALDASARRLARWLEQRAAAPGPSRYLD